MTHFSNAELGAAAAIAAEGLTRRRFPDFSAQGMLDDFEDGLLERGPALVRAAGSVPAGAKMYRVLGGDMPSEAELIFCWLFGAALFGLVQPEKIEAPDRQVASPPRRLADTIFERVGRSDDRVFAGERSLVPGTKINNHVERSMTSPVPEAARVDGPFFENMAMRQAPGPDPGPMVAVEPGVFKAQAQTGSRQIDTDDDFYGDAPPAKSRRKPQV